MRSKTGGEMVVESLQDIGVDRIFGIPGIHNLAIYDAIHDSGLRHIAARHEQGAGFMAIGHARVTGRPGLALVITGPGLANIATAMGQAYHDSIPMVVISSQIETSARNYRSGYLHEMKNSTFFASSVAKSSRCVEHGWQIENAIKEAYRLSMSGRPGPVHLEIPLDILQSELKVEISSIQDPCPVNSYENQVSKDEVNKALDMIRKADNPLILAGGGSVKASRQVREFSDKLAIPVVTTCAGKGVVDERSPLSLGCRLHFPSVQDLLLESDLVLALGSELSPTDFWQRSLVLGQKLLCVNTDPGAFYNQRTADLGIRGNVESFLSGIEEEDIDLPINPEERYRKVDEAVRKARESLASVTGINSEELQLTGDLLREVRASLGNDGIFWADMTSPSYVAVSEYQAYEPLTFLHPVGFGTLGVSLPGAIGTLVADPSRRVCVMAGDGGFQFTLQELAIASELNLPLPVIIWNDCGYGEIRRNQESRDPAKVIAVEHRGLNYSSLANAYNMDGISLESVSGLKDLLENCYRKNCPTIIEIKVKECL